MGKLDNAWEQLKKNSRDRGDMDIPEDIKNSMDAIVHGVLTKRIAVIPSIDKRSGDAAYLIAIPTDAEGSMIGFFMAALLLDDESLQNYASPEEMSKENSN